MLHGKGSWFPRDGTTWTSGNISAKGSNTALAVAKLCSLKDLKTTFYQITFNMIFYYT